MKRVVLTCLPLLAAIGGCGMPSQPRVVAEPPTALHRRPEMIVTVYPGMPDGALRVVRGELLHHGRRIDQPLTATPMQWEGRPAWRIAPADQLDASAWPGSAVQDASGQTMYLPATNKLLPLLDFHPLRYRVVVDYLGRRYSLDLPYDRARPWIARQADRAPRWVARAETVRSRPD
jgi:hypothetical protein